MEHERCEESRQTSLDFKCKKILPSIEKSSISSPASIQSIRADGEQDLDINLASPTPEKMILPSRSKNKAISLPVRAVKQNSKNIQNADVSIQSAVENSQNNTNFAFSEIPQASHHVLKNLPKIEASELPEKYKTIAEFFDHMDSSIRLLDLRKKLSTFQNICTQVEIFTKRKFSYCHLAQIKYIFPEAIQIEKVLAHDEKSLCMKADLKINLLWDTLEVHPNQSRSITLCHAFRARLLDFSNTHPEGGDIPEALLPGPFNQREYAMMPGLLLGSPMKKPEPISVELEPLSNISHLSPSFRREFSQRIIVPETEKSQLLASPVPLSSMATANEKNLDIKIPLKEGVSIVSASIKSPIRLIFGSDSCTNSHLSESPPVKPASTPDKLITETPEQTTPKRSMPTPDDNITIETSLLSSSTRRRFLDFSSPLKSFETLRPIAGATERLLLEEETKGSSSLLQTEKDDVCDVTNDWKMNQTSIGKREQMLACLPDLFNVVRLIFRSADSSSITKEELVHKILSYNCDVVDTREVEEQLKLLEELVPDWISGKMLSSGDFLYCIRKTSDPDLIRARLVEAV